MSEEPKSESPPSARRGQLAEFLSVWALIGAVLLCPWISAPALTDTGHFPAPTLRTLWILSAALLCAATALFAVFLRIQTSGRISPLRACGAYFGHAAATFLALMAAFCAADWVVARLRPLSASAFLDAPKAQIYGWAFAPRQRLEIRDPDSGVSYRETANGEGWRDIDHPATKTLPRILLLGDSILYGIGVPLEQTIGRQLQRALGDRAEVVAVGLPAWGTDQQFLFLESEGWRYQPDLVALMFTVGNDVLDNMSDHWTMGTAPKPCYRLVDGRLVLQPLTPWTPPRLRRLFRHSTILRHIRFRRQTRAMPRKEMQFDFARLPSRDTTATSAPLTAEHIHRTVLSMVRADWPPEVHDGWVLTTRLIEEMNRSCQAHGAKLVLYAGGQIPANPPPGLFPQSMTIGGETIELDYERPFRLLRETCRTIGIPYVEESEDLRADHWQGRLSFKNDAHPNAEGNRRHAEFLARWISTDAHLPDLIH